MGNSFVNVKIKSSKGLTVVAALLKLFNSSSSCLFLAVAFIHQIPLIYQLHPVRNESHAWLHYNALYHPILHELEEYSRLGRFYHVSKIIFKLFGKGNRLKGMYLFVGACLEGIPDPSVRIYAIGGQMTELTKRRESIYMKVTGVSIRVTSVSKNLKKKSEFFLLHKFVEIILPIRSPLLPQM